MILVSTYCQLGVLTSVSESELQMVHLRMTRQQPYNISLTNNLGMRLCYTWPLSLGVTTSTSIVSESHTQNVNVSELLTCDITVSEPNRYH